MDSTQNPLQDWILQKPYWEKFVWKTCFEKDVVQPEDVDYAYKFMLEDAGINEISVRAAISIIGNLGHLNVAALSKIQLKTISDFQNVNALPSSEKLIVGEQLTIVYGENGSGKSGISRLFGNACFFRGKRDLLPNVRTASTRTPSAIFSVTDNSGAIINHSYKLGDSILDLQRFYVFDTSSSVVHLDNTNTVKFTPLKLTVFDKVKKVFQEIEQKLETEKISRKKDNPASILFPNDADETSLFCKNINAETSNVLLESILSFNSDDGKLLEEFEKQLLEKEKLDVLKKKDTLKSENSHLTSLLTKLEGLVRNIAVDKQGSLNKLITSTQIKKGLSEKLSAKKFVHEKFTSVGSEKWTTLISVAKELYDQEGENSTDTCVLCQQDLSEKSKTLFVDYWEFLKGAARKEYEELQVTVKSSIEWIERNLTTFPDLPDTDIATSIIMRDNPDYLTLLKSEVAGLKPVLESWKLGLEKLSQCSNAIPLVTLAPLKDLIAAKTKEEQALSDPTAELKRLRGEITKLKSKRTATGAKQQFLEYKSYLDWIKKANAINFSSIRTGLTRKRTESFNQEVANQYAQLFSKECKTLNANFGLEIYTKGEAQDSKKGLRLSFAQNYAPSRILSEGEQKVCSIADFLTELKLDENSAGIIFDDPVTSLDHARKDLIAKRLVEESTERQVIVLTHDIVFFLALQDYARKFSINAEIQTVKKIGQVPGHIKSDVPWIAMSMVRRVAYLKNELQGITAVHKSGDADAYRKETKIWCEYLREAWERSIEESLFKGVVTRFSPTIQTHRLKDVVVTDEFKKAVNEGMTESSKWVHDQGAGLNAPTPEPDTLKNWLDSLEQYIKGLNQST